MSVYRDRVFDKSMPVICRKPFIGNGSHFLRGQEVDWKKMGISIARVRNMFSAGYLYHPVDEDNELEQDTDLKEKEELLANELAEAEIEEIEQEKEIEIDPILAKINKEMYSDSDVSVDDDIDDELLSVLQESGEVGEGDPEYWNNKSDFYSLRKKGGRFFDVVDATGTIYTEKGLSKEDAVAFIKDLVERFEDDKA